MAANIWQELPPDFKHLTTYSFKKQVRQYLLLKQHDFPNINLNLFSLFLFCVFASELLVTFAILLLVVFLIS